jgi:hypothetical protein
VTRLLLRRYDRDGTAIDAQPIALGNGSYYGDEISVLPDGDSFIIAWSHSTSSFAMRVPSRGPVAISPVKLFDALATADPHFVRLGGRPVVIWISVQDQTGYLIKGARLRDNLALDPPVNLWLVLTRYDGGTGLIAAEGNDQELMLVLGGNVLGDDLDCVRTRRFGLDLQPRGEASVLGCKTLAPYGNGDRLVPAVVWDGRQWWASYSNSYYSTTPLRLWPISADGKPETPVVVTDPEVKLLDVRLLRTPLGLAALYTHADANAAAIFRAYQLPLLLQQPPKSRSARH